MPIYLYHAFIACFINRCIILNCNHFCGVNSLLQFLCKGFMLHTNIQPVRKLGLGAVFHSLHKCTLFLCTQVERDLFLSLTEFFLNIFCQETFFLFSSKLFSLSIICTWKILTKRNFIITFVIFVLTRDRESQSWLLVNVPQGHRQVSTKHCRKWASDKMIYGSQYSASGQNNGGWGRQTCAELERAGPV